MDIRPPRLACGATASAVARGSFLFLLLLLAGCAARAPASGSFAPAPAYVAPTEGQRATLLVRVNHPGGRYGVATFEQPASCSHRREITSGTDKAPERTSHAITAGRLQTLSFVFLRGDRKACEITLSFEPARDRIYLMRSTADASRCRVELIDATTPERPAAVALARREPVGYGRLDGACKPLTAAIRATPGADAAGSSLDDFKDLLPQQ